MTDEKEILTRLHNLSSLMPEAAREHVERVAELAFARGDLEELLKLLAAVEHTLSAPIGIARLEQKLNQIAAELRRWRPQTPDEKESA